MTKPCLLLIAFFSCGILLCSQANGQGLKGSLPAHYSGTYEQYKTEMQKNAEEMHACNAIWQASEFVCAWRTVPIINDMYGEVWLKEAFAWEAADENIHAETYFKKAIACENNVERQVAFMHFYANFLGTNLRSKEENAVLRRSLAFQEKAFGKDSPELCSDLMYLAGNEWTSINETVVIYRRCLSIWASSDYDFYQAIVTSRLAQCLDRLGKKQEAEQEYIKAIAILDEHDKNNVFLLGYVYDLARFYLRFGRTQDAEPLLARTVVIWEHYPADDNRGLARSAFNDYAKLLTDQGKLAAARRIAVVASKIPQR